jgi:gamma-glutamyltranspeptidase/glutathione hydrolase
VERTEVQATSNWNITRADVTAFFAAKLRGLPFPKPQAELYITTPEQIKLGESVRAEGLVLNGSGKMVTVRTTLINSSGAAVAPIATADVHPGNDGDASAGLNTSITSFPSGRFLRAKAELIDKATGTVLQQVTSAPIVVYAADANPTFSLHRLYYSIPASKALPGRPTLSLSGNPVTSTTAMATVTAPSGTAVRFNEVIQNTRQVGNGFTVNPYSVSIPMSSRTIIGGQVTNASKDGFYLGRVIDEQERVGYTDPVYVAP